MAYLSVSINSEILGGLVRVDMIMPQGRGGYKVLYLLHGAGGDRLTWLLRSRIADYAENRNIAVVMPSGNNMFYVNSVCKRNYYDFITRELPQYTERIFNVSGSADNRYIAGNSMGGYGALYAGIKSYGNYKKVYAMSPYTNIGPDIENNSRINLKQVFGSKEDFHSKDYDIRELCTKNGTNSGTDVEKHTEFVILCGNNDKRTDKSQCMELARDMNLQGYKTVCEISEGGHDWDYWDQCIKRILEDISSDTI